MGQQLGVRGKKRFATAGGDPHRRPQAGPRKLALAATSWGADSGSLGYGEGRRVGFVAVRGWKEEK